MEELADEDPPELEGVRDGHDAAREGEEEEAPPEAEAGAGGPVGEEEVEDPGEGMIDEVGGWVR